MMEAKPGRYFIKERCRVNVYICLLASINFLSVLTGYGEEQVFEHFKRNLTTGLRKGHKVSIITSDVKDFVFFYKQNQGKLVISFNFGEWNSSGFPQHC